MAHSKRNPYLGFFHHAISRDDPKTVSWNEYREKLKHLKHSPFIGFFTFLETEREQMYRSMRSRRRKRTHFSSLNWFVAAFEQKLYSKVSESNVPGESTVVLVTCPRTKNLFALKVIRKTRFTREQEVNIHSRMDHPNIVKLLDSCETFDRSYLLLEKMKSDLRTEMYNRGRFNEMETATLMAQLLSALEYIHVKHEIVHGDIKPENILISVDSSHTHIYLSDFGNAFDIHDEDDTARNEEEKDAFFMCQGSYEYAAPEVMLDVAVMCRDFPIDMWAVGVVAFELIAGFEPFYPPSAALKEELVFSSRYWIDISSQCQHFVRNLLSRVPEDRMQASEALKSSWLWDEGDDEKEKMRCVLSH